ncbi:MAG: LysM peptidoglycan-binding domain-containing protein [Geobacteraceae bacterium]|nr:LysM peptidoglycan-binding domain-containing protein [Geobacteraceae bacterium]NTW79501.1 LysM peptidoglycan-binding domain-containing protein [Geobacteraceae bacterium]
MTPSCRITIVISLAICLAIPAWGQQYLLYTPQPATAELKTPPPDGILVQEIEIQKGDTLYDLSRKFSGRGMYFPQILLFNSIKNPNMIYSGKTLRVPVTHKEVHDSEQINHKLPDAVNKPRTSMKSKKAPLKSVPQTTPRQSDTVMSQVSSASTELSLSDLKTVATKKKKESSIKKRNAGHTKKKPSHVATAKTSSSPLASASATHKIADTAGQKLFEAAVKAYRKDDCRTALELLDQYLIDNSGSPLAADANLYKAECYLKLSAQ